ncbi:hypothetical protein KZZ52_17135 [Dactylosporangium sp. AC04546]|uniref:hypothetical protein n=1 Tax=Dactylosporangium sp. AC04546 TaxID=2862460 RepID=UPI001EDD0061|nr:hypothetical protein [Dactylosporangium sp. AC04546]WVK87023.1 hypothetical protein KZZ52_17135 [Dactylosporangium sp. AC04546]
MEIAAVPDTAERTGVSRVPAILGLSLIGVAAAGIATLVTVSVGSVRAAATAPDGLPFIGLDAVEMLVPPVLLLAGLVIAASLVLTGRHAGRSAVVWLSVFGAVILVQLLATRFDVFADVGVRWVGPPKWIGQSGIVAAAVALAGAAIVFMRPAAQRWATARLPGDASAAPSDAPAVLRRAAWNLGAGGALMIVAVAGRFLVRLPAFDATETSLAVLVILGIAGLLLTVVAGAFAGAVLAQRGRRGGAVLARVAGALLLYSAMWGVYALVSDALYWWYLEADLYFELPPRWSPVAVSAGGFALLAAAIGAAGLLLAGLARLADPRIHQYLNDGRTTGQPTPGYRSWTAIGPADGRTD